MKNDGYFKRLISKVSDSSLLLIVMSTIFIIPLFSHSLYLLLYSIGYSLIFILASLAVNKFRSGILIFAVVIIILQWSPLLFNFPLLDQILKLLSIIFFCAIVVSFISQVAKAKEVSLKVIVESINGYLMIGLAFAALISIIVEINPSAYFIPDIDLSLTGSQANLYNYLYYTFVTLTTVGYGDILPKTAGTKSLAIFIAIVGQFYIAIIIATLVSKYISKSK